MKLTTKVWIRCESIGEKGKTKEQECDSLAEAVRVALEWMLQEANLVHRVELTIARERDKLGRKGDRKVKEAEDALEDIFAQLKAFELESIREIEPQAESHGATGTGESAESAESAGVLGVTDMQALLAKGFG